jgi:nucleoside recognition membrane protein YjiH
MAGRPGPTNSGTRFLAKVILVLAAIGLLTVLPLILAILGPILALAVFVLELYIIYLVVAYITSIH